VSGGSTRRERLGAERLSKLGRKRGQILRNKFKHHNRSSKRQHATSTSKSRRGTEILHLMGKPDGMPEWGKKEGDQASPASFNAQFVLGGSMEREKPRREKSLEQRIVCREGAAA